MSADLQTVLTAIRRQRDDARTRYRVEMIGVAGSLARGEAGPESDIDIVVDFLPGASLFKIGGLLCELEAAFARRVDLLDRHALKAPFRAAVERDLVAA